MQIDKLPGVYYNENVTYELTGGGSKIPIFIGRTGNTGSENYKVDGTSVLRFTKYDEVKQLPTNSSPGIGVSSSTNVLSSVIEEFYEEVALVNSSDIGVPYIYVIDVGNGKSYEAWKNALKTAKTLHDINVEVYVGAEMVDNVAVLNKSENDASNVQLVDFLSVIYNGVTSNDDYGLVNCAKNLDLRSAFTTVIGASDLNLIGLTNSFSESRIGICEPLLFGKSIARICCTPYNREVGFYSYRSVSPGEFKQRSKDDMKKLQDAGIIFNSDEHINNKIYPKMNLCIATSFVDNPTPADSLFHARFNADDLLSEIFEACYSQVKDNESATNIAYLQTRINKIVNDRVTSEEMIKYDERKGTGTKLVVSPSDYNPYSLIVSGQIQPIKCSVAIEVEATIKL